MVDSAVIYATIIPCIGGKAMSKHSEEIRKKYKTKNKRGHYKKHK